MKLEHAVVHTATTRGAHRKEGGWARTVWPMLAWACLLGCLALAASPVRAQGTGKSSVTLSDADPIGGYISQAFVLRATVSGSLGTPTGTVVFVGDQASGDIGRGTLVDGNASVLANFSKAGDFNFYVKYSGDGVYAANTSIGTPGGLRRVHVAAQNVTKTTLSASATTGVVGQSVTLKAGVTGIVSGENTAFTFKDGATVLGQVLRNASNAASLKVTLKAAGARKFTATYDGNVPDAPSTSPAVTVTVSKGTPTVTLATSAASVFDAQAVTLTATLSLAMATGTVTFKDGSKTLGTAPVAGGKAVLKTAFASAGAHSLTAAYAGDANVAAATSAALAQTVKARTVPQVSLAATPATLTVGQGTTLKARVSGAAGLGGTVTFQDGATVLGSATLAAGAASLDAVLTSAGRHDMKVLYSGDVAHTAGTPAVSAVTVEPMTTTTTLQVTPEPYTEGERVTLSARVSGYQPGAAVTFSDGATALGSVALSAGIATLDARFARGPHALSANYAGDERNRPSTSATATAVALAPVPAASAPQVRYEYDALGNPTATRVARDAAGAELTTRGEYDRLQRLRRGTDARGGVVQIGYDALGRPTQLADPRGLVTTATRSGLGDVLGLASPDTGTETRSVDEAGNLSSRTDSRGVQARYRYDALNRLVAVDYTRPGQPGEPGLGFAWVYDQADGAAADGTPAYGLGRLTGTRHPSGSSSYAYDPLGRVVRETQRLGATSTGAGASVREVRYRYDDAGHVVAVVYPSGRVLTRRYEQGELRSLALARDATSAPVDLLTGIGYSPFGAARRWQWVMADGSTDSHDRAYDTAGRLVRYRLGERVRDLAYDAADRITAYTHVEAATGTASAQAAAADQRFDYDELGRVVRIAAGGSTWVLEYDANGNRTRVTRDTAADTYTTDATRNRLLGQSAGARHYEHDDAGNTVADLRGEDRAGGTFATYDLANRLASLTRAGATVAFAYDAFGRRVRKVVQPGPGGAAGGAETIDFVYDLQGHLLGEYDGAGAALRELVWLDDTPVAVLTPEPGAADGAVAVSYIHADHLDTPRVVVDRRGAVRWRWLSEPFGSTEPETDPSGLGPFTFNLRMPGQYADRETGLFYNHFRDYDPGVGRYVQADPIGLAGGSPSLYTYGDNTPTMHADPFGLATYMCTQPLHALGRFKDFFYAPKYSPLYHQYVGVLRPDGSVITGGQDRAEGAWGPGKPSTGDNAPVSGGECKKVEDDNECIESCLIGKFSEARPSYALALSGMTNGGQNCQAWANNTLGQCRAACKARK